MSAIPVKRMTKYERIKAMALIFIAVVLVVWAAISIGTIVRFHMIQTAVEKTPPDTASFSLVDTLHEMADRLDRLELQCDLAPSS